MKTSDNKPRLAILGTRGIPAKYGGFETFADEISVRLAEQGVDVTVYCMPEGEAVQAVDYKRVQLRYVTPVSLGPLTTIVFDLICLWRSRRGFDVVYMLGYGASLFCFIPRLFGSRVWINMDGVEWRRSKWSWLAKAWLRASEAFAMWTPNRIIADAAAIKTELCARHPHLPPCAVIPYGAPVVTDAQPRLLDEWNLDASGYCLVVCRLEPENHVFEILEGYLASASRLPLVVVGNYTTDTPYVRHLLALSDDRIRLIGTIYDASKLQALRLFARLYFHGHSAGGTNPSLLEAMGCGNAVIAHDNPFNREVAADAALYFSSSGDIPALLEKVASDSTRRAAMQDAARRIVTERYTWESVTEAYLSLLSSDRSRVP